MCSGFYAKTFVCFERCALYVTIYEGASQQHVTALTEGRELCQTESFAISIKLRSRQSPSCDFSEEGVAQRAWTYFLYIFRTRIAKLQNMPQPLLQFRSCNLQERQLSSVCRASWCVAEVEQIGSNGQTGTRNTRHRQTHSQLNFIPKTLLHNPQACIQYQENSTCGNAA